MNFIDHLIRGLSIQSSQKVDMVFTKTVCLLKYNS